MRLIGCVVACTLVLGAVAQAPGVAVATVAGLDREDWCCGQSTGRLLVAYVDGGLQLTSSVDGGEAWTGASTIAAQGGRPVIVSDHQRVAIVYLSSTTGDANVMLVHSLDAGATWSSPRQLDTGPAAVRTDARCAITPLAIHVAWREGGNLKYNRLSLPSLSSLASDVTVTGSVSDAACPSIAALDYVTFTLQFRSAVLITQNRILGAGDFAVCLDAGSGAPVFHSVAVATSDCAFAEGRLAAPGLFVPPSFHAVWQAPDSAGNEAITVAYSHGDATSASGWTSAVLDAGTEPAMAMLGGSGLGPRPVVVFRKRDPDPPHAWRIWASTGHHTGNSIEMSVPVPLSSPSATMRASNPRLASDDGVVWCIWRSTHGSSHQVHANRSRDHGASWLPPNEARSFGGPVGQHQAGPLGNRDMNIVMTENYEARLGSSAHVLWYRDDAASELRAARAMGSALYGAGSGSTGLQLGVEYGWASLGGTILFRASMKNPGPSSYWVNFLIGRSRGPTDLGEFDAGCAGVDLWVGVPFGGQGGMSTPSGEYLFYMSLPTSLDFLGTNLQVTAVAQIPGARGCPFDVSAGIETRIF